MQVQTHMQNVIFIPSILKDMIFSLGCVFSVAFYLTSHVQKETPDKIGITNNVLP